MTDHKPLTDEEIDALRVRLPRVAATVDALRAERDEAVRNAKRAHRGHKKAREERNRARRSAESLGAGRLAGLEADRARLRGERDRMALVILRTGLGHNDFDIMRDTGDDEDFAAAEFVRTGMIEAGYLLPRDEEGE